MLILNVLILFAIQWKYLILGTILTMIWEIGKFWYETRVEKQKSLQRLLKPNEQLFFRNEVKLGKENIFTKITGDLTVTDERIIFEPFACLNPKETIYLNEVNSLDKKDMWSFSSNALVIKLKDGREYKFVVPKKLRENLISSIKF